LQLQIQIQVQDLTLLSWCFDKWLSWSLDTNSGNRKFFFY
jgi:hypothetical protein